MSAWILVIIYAAVIAIWFAVNKFTTRLPAHKKLYVDDIRKPNSDGWKIVRNYNAAIYELNKGIYDLVSLDHDLGEEKTGYDIAKWMEEKAYTDPNWKRPELHSHSANPVGRRNIEAVAKKLNG